ncbi:MAG: DUF547 domain-containing protein [Bacteroidota bacterium]|nr:DUF547 domain-containing protein [Bacteroidota bacterium]
MKKKYITMSQDLLYSIRVDENPQKWIDSLAVVPQEVLLTELETDDEKKAFWLNIYNAFVQYILKKNPEKFKSRSSFYKAKQVTIAGKKLSLDDIEHGIIRHSKAKLSLGYTRKLFAGKFEKQFRVHQLDNRVHFALNCGAKSCPAVAYYVPADLNDQLESAVTGYLQAECTYKDGVSEVPVLFSWFRGDFGGKKGIKKYLKKYKVIPDNSDPSLKFKKYDWTLQLSNYVTQ